MAYSECGNYKIFTDHGKPVFNVEYNDHNGKVCNEAKQFDLISIYEDGGNWKNCF